MSVVAVAEEMSDELMAEINAGRGPGELDSWYSSYSQMYIQFDGQSTQVFDYNCQQNFDDEKRKNCGWRETIPITKDEKTFSGEASR